MLLTTRQHLLVAQNDMLVAYATQAQQDNSYAQNLKALQQICFNYIVHNDYYALENSLIDLNLATKYTDDVDSLMQDYVYSVIK